MKVKDILNDNRFTVLNESNFDREISGIYCCDLLSIVMGRAPSDCAWITVMGNINGIAVSVLADMSIIIVAEGMVCDPAALEKAKQQNVNVISTELPIFDAAETIYKMLS